MRNESRYAVIVGCGRLGAFLASSLSEQGFSVVVIDRDGDCFAELSAGFSGFTIEGDAGEFLTLQRAKVDRARIFVAATGSDSVNLMSAQIARVRYAVPYVASRIYDRDLEDFCRSLDVFPMRAVAIEAESFLHTIEQRGNHR